jgi:hypothetical protein
MVMYAAVPVQRGFGAGFSHWVSCALRALVRISRVTRAGMEERKSHDVLLGVAGLCRSLRAPGGSWLERGIM